MPESRIEFAVQMTCDSCVAAVKKTLAGEPKISSVDVDLEKGSVVVVTTLATLQVQEKLEATGKKVVGVVRFVQVSPNSCIIDGTVDGLDYGVDHKLTVHECGDLSKGCESVGDIYQENNCRYYGDLGSIPVSTDGRSVFKKENSDLKLADVIGRSLVVSSGGKRLVCGIIARSAGLFQNPKTICACDGITIWNEKVPPRSVL